MAKIHRIRPQKGFKKDKRFKEDQKKATIRNQVRDLSRKTVSEIHK
jgi:hypothetical protein